MEEIEQEVHLDSLDYNKFNSIKEFKQWKEQWNVVTSKLRHYDLTGVKLVPIYQDKKN
jgi:hypothetical protein